MESTKSEKASSSVPVPTANSQMKRPMTPVNWTAPKSKAVVVGLYGIQGSGKTFLMHQLKQEFRQERFAFYESSELIDLTVPGGLPAFKNLDDEAKDHWRKHAIDIIGKSYAVSGKVAVVSGHLGFWSKSKKAADIVCTDMDLNTYTHFIYLDTPAELVAERSRADKTRGDRPELSVSDLAQWQQTEKTELRDVCREYGILLSVVISGSNLLKKVSMLLRDFEGHDEEYNLSQAEICLDQVLLESSSRLETMLVMDADRTLAAEDTGNMFWEMRGKGSTLKDLLSSELKYSYTAFRQVALLYEETGNNQVFDAACEEVALAVTMYPEMVSILKRASGESHVGAVVVTCGLRRVWEKILEKNGLATTVTVIGGGRIADGYVVTAAVKGALVTRLREVHNLYVWAFGDGPLDLDMFSKADQAVVVVGEEQTRSKRMDKELTEAIDKKGLKAKQALLPNTASPRLDTTKLPLVDLTDKEYVDSIFRQSVQRSGPRVLLATYKSAAKLLATAARDARVAGPALRKAHGRIGRYLAIEYLTDVIGLVEISITHVLGKPTSGFQFRGEKQTTIVALMRGGNPMALGVGDVLPLAMYVHAKSPEDIDHLHLEGQQTVVLVDSVVNLGTTVKIFVEYIHDLQENIHIVIVASVIQADFLGNKLAEIHAIHNNLSVVALRTSDTSFIGAGTTDTGHRLFNTTHMDYLGFLGAP